MAIFKPFKGVIVPAREIAGTRGADELRKRVASAEFPPRPEPDIYLYSVKYSAGDGRVKTASMLGALAPVSAREKKPPRAPDRMFFVYDYESLEEEILAQPGVGEPLFELERDGVLHRLSALPGETADAVANAFKAAGFCHDIEGKTSEDRLAPVWIGNLGKDGWAFAPEGAFLGDGDADKILKSASAHFRIREYAFPKKSGRPTALEDFLEDLRFEAVIAGVMGFAPAGKKSFYLFMHENPDVDMRMATVEAAKLELDFSRMLPGPAIEEAEKKGESLFLTHPAMKREVVVIAQAGATRISEFPLCFSPLEGLLWDVE